MYPIESKVLRGARSGAWSGVGRNVYFLGLTSFLTDISSEMVASVLPIYMVVVLRLTPLQIGIVDGLYQGAAAVARLAGGFLADRWQRNREVAAVGYGLSAICKLGLLLVGGTWSLLSAVIALDRVGKGIRTAPRDALISLSSARERLGLAFGVHRALDTAGALLGPLIAFAALAFLPGGYDLVFVASFFIALTGVAALLIFVRNVPAAMGTTAATAAKPTLQEAALVLRSGALGRIVWCGALLALVSAPDAFFYLTLQRRSEMSPSAFPLLFIATALTYLLLAIPAGRLGDRIGRGRVFVLGHVALACACLVVLMPAPSFVAGIASLALLGSYYACTDGVLMAAASQHLPERLRASGLAIVTTATGLARLLASVGFGAVWQGWSMETAFAIYAAGMVTVVAITARVWIRLEERPAT